VIWLAYPEATEATDEADFAALDEAEEAAELAEDALLAWTERMRGTTARSVLGCILTVLIEEGGAEAGEN